MHPAETTYWLLIALAMFVAFAGVYGVVVSFGIWIAGMAVLLYASARERQGF